MFILLSFCLFGVLASCSLIHSMVHLAGWEKTAKARQTLTDSASSSCSSVSEVVCVSSEDTPGSQRASWGAQPNSAPGPQPNSAPGPSAVWLHPPAPAQLWLQVGRTVLSAHALGDLCCSECGSRPPLPALPPLRPLRLHSFNLTLASGTYLWVLPCSVNSKFSPRTTLCFATNNNNKSNNS